jgi:hypothetical protein
MWLSYAFPWRKYGSRLAQLVQWLVYRLDVRGNVGPYPGGRGFFLCSKASWWLWGVSSTFFMEGGDFSPRVKNYWIHICARTRTFIACTRALFHFILFYAVRSRDSDWTERDWLCAPPKLIFSGYRVSFSGVKQPGREAAFPSSAFIEWTWTNLLFYFTKSKYGS